MCYISQIGSRMQVSIRFYSMVYVLYNQNSIFVLIIYSFLMCGINLQSMGDLLQRKQRSMTMQRAKHMSNRFLFRMSMLQLTVINMHTILMTYMIQRLLSSLKDHFLSSYINDLNTLLLYFYFIVIVEEQRFVMTISFNR